MKRTLCAMVAVGLLAAQAKADYVFATLDAPGAAGTEAHGINNLGQIVGIAISSGGTSSSGFLLSGGSYTPVNVPGVPRTDAQKINDSGQIVGFQNVPAFGAFSGFLYDGGNYTILKVPGSTSTLSQGINNSGQIVGSFTNSPNPHVTSDHGFLLSGGNYSTLPLPAGDIEVHAINNAGRHRRSVYSKWCSWLSPPRNERDAL